MFVRWIFFYFFQHKKDWDSCLNTCSVHWFNKRTWEKNEYLYLKKRYFYLKKPNISTEIHQFSTKKCVDFLPKNASHFEVKFNQNRNWSIRTLIYRQGGLGRTTRKWHIINISIQHEKKTLEFHSVLSSFLCGIINKTSWTAILNSMSTNYMSKSLHN